MRFILSSRNLIVTNRSFLNNINGYIFRNLELCAFHRSYSSLMNHSFTINTNKVCPLLNLKNIDCWASFSRSSVMIKYKSTSSSSNITPENVIDLTKQSSELAIQSSSSLLENQIVPSVITETSVSSLNLGSNYTPIGWCIHYLDFLHSVFPWWGSIAIGTLILRVCMFPFVVSAQRSSAKLNEILPEQAILKEKMNHARITGDSVEFARLSQEAMTVYKRRGVNPFKAMLAPFAQAPVFITFFITLRRMANYPVESLKTGGILWFTDLSISDPFYALPLITSLTLWLALETSFRSGLNPNQTPFIKYGARIIPLVTLAFTFNFPSAIMMYWCTNNFISLIQVYLLQFPKVRSFLNIPQIKVNPQQLEINKKSFKQHFRETIDNAKINRMMEERKTLDEISFKKAGIGPLQKTYRQDPTRMQNN